MFDTGMTLYSAPHTLPYRLRNSQDLHAMSPSPGELYEATIAELDGKLDAHFGPTDFTFKIDDHVFHLSRTEARSFSLLSPQFHALIAGAWLESYTRVAHLTESDPSSFAYLRALAPHLNHSSSTLLPLPRLDDPIRPPALHYPPSVPPKLRRRARWTRLFEPGRAAWEPSVFERAYGLAQHAFLSARAEQHGGRARAAQLRARGAAERQRTDLWALVDLWAFADYWNVRPLREAVMESLQALVVDVNALDGIVLPMAVLAQLIDYVYDKTLCRKPRAGDIATPRGLVVHYVAAKLDELDVITTMEVEDWPLVDPCQRQYRHFLDLMEDNKSFLEDVRDLYFDSLPERPQLPPADDERWEQFFGTDAAKVLGYEKKSVVLSSTLFWWNRIRQNREAVALQQAANRQTPRRVVNIRPVNQATKLKRDSVDEEAGECRKDEAVDRAKVVAVGDIRAGISFSI